MIGVETLTAPPEALPADLAQAARMLAAADWCGWQEFPGNASLALWNLRRDIPGHPAGSTVVSATLFRALFGTAAVKLGTP